MNLIPLTCPKCNAQLEVERRGDYAFCQFCGTKIYLEKPDVKKIKIDQTDTIENYLIRAERFMKEGNVDRALEYYDKVLDIDADNEEANEALKKTIIHPNVFITRKKSFQSAGRTFSYYIDGQEVLKLSDGASGRIIVPYGEHIFRAEGPGVKPEEKKITIHSFRTKIDIEVSIKIGLSNHFIISEKYR